MTKTFGKNLNSFNKVVAFNPLMLLFNCLWVFELWKLFYRTAASKCFHILLWKFPTCKYKSCQLSINAHTKMFPCTYTSLGIPKVGKVEQKEELKTMLNLKGIFLQYQISYRVSSSHFWTPIGFLFRSKISDDCLVLWNQLNKAN